MKYLLTLLLVWISIQSTIGQTSNSQELFDSIASISEFPGYETYILHLNRLKVIANEENNDDAYINSLFGLSTCYYNINDFYNFEKVVEESVFLLESDKKVLPGQASVIINNSAILENIKGDYTSGNINYNKAIELEKSNNKDPYQLGALYDNIAWNYYRLGDYKQGLANAEKSLNYRSSDTISNYTNNPGLKETKIGSSYYLIGYNYLAMDSFQNALYFFDKSIKSLTSVKPNQAIYQYLIDNHLRISEIYVKLLNIKIAKSELAKAIKYQAKNPHRLYKTEELKGLIANHNSDYSLGMKHLTKAFDLALDKYGDSKENQMLPRIQMQIGDTYCATEALEQGLLKYHQALKLIDDSLESNLNSQPNVKRLSKGPIALELLRKKARVAQQLFKDNQERRNLNIANNSYKAAIDLIDQMRLSYLTEGSKYYVAESSQKVYAEYIEFLFQFKNQLDSNEFSQDLYQVMEKNKSVVLIEAISNKYALIQATLPKQLIDTERKLKSKISFLKMMMDQEELKDQKDNITYTALKDDLFNKTEELKRLNIEIQNNHPNYYSVKDDLIKLKLLPQIQKEMDEGTLIVEYFVSDSVIYTLGISADNTYAFNIKLNMSSVKATWDGDLMSALSYYLQYISSKPDQSSDRRKATNASTFIFDHLLSEIMKLNPNKTNLIIVPDGLLSSIPFESLINTMTIERDFLIQTHTIAYSIGISQIYNDSKIASKKGSNIIGFAPEFTSSIKSNRNTDCILSELGEIPYAKDEVEYLASYYNSKVLLDHAATMANFKNESTNFDIVHLATHACLNINQPMLTELFFSDGSLTCYDLQNLDINPALVVLSACNTAQGSFQKGEGVISLTRGFLQAGVKSLQSSLWSIDDYASSEIIKKMYDNLFEGKKKSQALRLAKLSYLKDADKLRSHPYYWAGIIQIGDDAPIITNKWYQSIWVYFYAAVFLFGLFYYFMRSKRNNS